MGGKPTPRSVGLIVLAVFIAITVGPILAEARAAGTIPFLSACPTVTAQSTPGLEIAVPLIKCGVGTLLVLAVPSLIAVGYLLLNRR